MFKFFKGDNWFTKIKDGLLKTRENLTARVKSLFSMRKKIDEELWEELEEVLICSDMGVHTSNMIIEDLTKRDLTNMDTMRLDLTRKDLIGTNMTEGDSIDLESVS